MATSLGIWNLLLLGVIHCYDNICERSSCMATLSSVSKNLSADKVIDGNTEQDYYSCSHTVVHGAPEAWVMVDLRKEYKLQNVVIYYRNEKGDYTWRPYRFRQYSLQVSSDTLSWNECYKDNTPDSRIPSSIQNITCARTARYIRIITNYDAPEDDQFSERGAVLEICEIQIFDLISCHKFRNVDGSKNFFSYELEYEIFSGCDSNHYRSDCSMECSVNCKRQTCDNAKGSCTYGCNSGFYSEKCEKRCSTCPSACNRQSGECEGPCPNGMYGNHCNITCSRNCENGCSKIDGLCTSGCIDGKFGIDCLQTCGGGCSSRCDQADGNCSCKTGWLGQNCNECDSHHYGLDCTQVCGVNCKRQTCDNATGSCTYGCKNGFYSEKCEKRCSASCPSACNRKSGQCEGPCPNGMYGHHCNFTCNRTCKNGCRKIDGLCTSGCIDGKFGADCLKTCGAGCISGCNQLDGNCFCKEGWQGQNCNECDSHHYGLDCTQVCGVNCKRQTCDNATGSCTYGCKNGFYSEKCEKRCSASCPSACNRKSGQCEGPCPNGMYGHHCNFTCNRTCKNGCRKIDGLCTSGCIDGKFGADCLKTCGAGCISGCNQLDGNCFCKEGWQGQNCNECSQTHHGQECEKQCSPTCLNGTCFSNNGSCKDVFDSNVNNDKTSPAINQTSASITNTEVYPVLYGVITVLIMSVILNIFLIVRNIRNNNRPALNRDHNHANSTINASSTIHERTEDDTNYEELGQSSEPPLYEELKCI